MVWHKSFSNKLGRLEKGVGNIFFGSNTIFFIPKSHVPHDWKVTYRRIVCEIKSHKSETNRKRLTVGGNIIDYSGEFTTNTSAITTSKTLINSTISIHDATFFVHTHQTFISTQ